MPSKMYRFTGPIRWSKVFEHNRDMEGYRGAAVEYGGLYSVEMKLDPDQWETLKESGAQKQGKKNDPEWVKWTRKHEGPFKEASGAPRVVKKDNTLWDVDEDGIIGNESLGEVSIVVFTLKGGGYGTRLEKLKVLEHNEYVPEPVEEEEDEPEVSSKETAEIPF